MHRPYVLGMPSHRAESRCGRAPRKASGRANRCKSALVVPPRLRAFRSCPSRALARATLCVPPCQQQTATIAGPSAFVGMTTRGWVRTLSPYSHMSGCTRCAASRQGLGAMPHPGAMHASPLPGWGRSHSSAGTRYRRTSRMWRSTPSRSCRTICMASSSSHHRLRGQIGRASCRERV